MLQSILIIDDNQDILNLVADVLKNSYVIVKSTDAREALTMLSSVSVQLIISDVVMPGMDGFEFCKAVKSSFEHCHIPIILLTAKNTLMSRIEGLELGADAYIDKPFSPRHLKAQVANLISNRNTLKDYFVNSPLVHIKTMATVKADELFLERLNDIIIRNLDNAQLDGGFLADALHMSRPTLYRKVKAISNLTVNELTNLTRLKKAAELLAAGQYRVFEVANITGFNSPNQFNRIFHKQFNMSPSNFIKNQSQK
ncbi:MAG: response regulator transcription factor [Sphingobacteriaceae bacterium]|nr:MAG: response regulator transcription factor [Sphingobacteriaceae bacterium]